MKFLTEPLTSSHDRSQFSCGKAILDNYFKTQAGQDIKRNLASTYVLKHPESSAIIGYYTLSLNGIPKNWIPESLQKKLPASYSTLPTVLLGRLAIDQTAHGKGWGKMLLIDAFRRCMDVSKSMGIFALIVDPLDDEAIQFYLKYGFIQLPDSGKMFLPMKTIHDLFAN